MTPTKTLIVIPAYNEEQALPTTLDRLADLPPNYECLIVDDGSTDATPELSRELARQAGAKTGRAVHVTRLAVNSGIGVAMQLGFMFAERRGDYDYVVQFDGDGQHDAAFIEALVRTCQEHDLDLCVGSRFLDPQTGQFLSTLPRRIGIRFFARLISGLSGTRVTDPTSGFRCHGPRAWRYFAKSYPEDYPEPEALFWCARNHLRIGEIPVRMHARQGGTSSIRMAHSVYYMLKVSWAILIDRLRVREQV